MQINTSLLKSLSHINWPPEFVALLSFFDTLFFSLLDGNFLSEAVGNRANAANVTVFFCIGFLIFAAAVPTFYWLWVKLRRVPAKMREPFYDACIKVIVVMLFIFFPILSRNLLRLFLSRDINDTRLLSDDPRILYDSVGGWRVAASLFLALYTVGIPVYFFSCLWTAARPESQSYRSERQMRKYGLLFQKYEPEAWWWEMVELVRKLLLTSCLAFIAPGSLAQIFSGILLSLLALVLLAFFTPFVDARLDAVSVSCQVATVLTLLCAVVLKASDPAGQEERSFRAAVNVGVVAVQFLPFVTTAFLLVLVSKDMRAMYRKHLQSRAELPAALRDDDPSEATSGKERRLRRWAVAVDKAVPVPRERRATRTRVCRKERHRPEMITEMGAFETWQAGRGRGARGVSSVAVLRAGGRATTGVQMRAHDHAAEEELKV